MKNRERLTPGTVIGYLRVSTPGQVREGVSLDAQKGAIEAWARVHAPSRPLVFAADEGVSGFRTANRPGFIAAREAVLKCRGVLVVYSLSRLARSTKDALETVDRLQKAGAGLVSLSEAIDTTTAAGKMALTMLAAFAQFERDAASERTKSALAHLRAQGRRLGRHLAFGYDLHADGRRLVENANEQASIVLMLQLRAGGASLRAIARALQERSIRTKQGRSTWTASAVADVLRRSGKRAA